MGGFSLAIENSGDTESFNGSVIAALALVGTTLGITAGLLSMGAVTDGSIPAQMWAGATFAAWVATGSAGPGAGQRRQLLLDDLRHRHRGWGNRRDPHRGQHEVDRRRRARRNGAGQSPDPRRPGLREHLSVLARLAGSLHPRAVDDRLPGRRASSTPRSTGPAAAGGSSFSAPFLAPLWARSSASRQTALTHFPPCWRRGAWSGSAGAAWRRCG